jgi:hypothetical protein
VDPENDAENIKVKFFWTLQPLPAIQADNLEIIKKIQNAIRPTIDKYIR